MSLGNEWKNRLQASQKQSAHEDKLQQAAAVMDRAQEIIAKLKQDIRDAIEHRHLVMSLDEGETKHPFKELYGKKFTSSDEFMGAAKIVVNYCLANDFDVYVWEYDFKMSIGSFGGEIWVTPQGIPYHLSGQS